MITRRAFLQNSTLCLAGFSGLQAADSEAKALLKVGLMTDLHYADKPPTKTRFYREALAKLDEAVEVMNREKPALVVELGDLAHRRRDRARTPQETPRANGMTDVRVCRRADRSRARLSISDASS